MNYQEWENIILKDNSIEEMIEQFRSSADKVQYVDRHIIDSIDDIPQLEDGDNFWSAENDFWSVCNAAIALLEQWHDYVFDLRDTGVLASVPYLSIHDQWLLRQETAPPPSISLVLAKQSRFLKPDFFFNASLGNDSPNDYFKNWLMGKGNQKVRIKDPEQEHGSWIIMF